MTKRIYLEQILGVVLHQLDLLGVLVRLGEWVSVPSLMLRVLVVGDHVGYLVEHLSFHEHPHSKTFGGFATLRKRHGDGG